MTELFFLRADYTDQWTQVTREEWVRAERGAGFWPKGADIGQPATGGFSGHGVNGRYTDAATFRPEQYNWDRNYRDAVTEAVARLNEKET